MLQKFYIPHFIASQEFQRFYIAKKQNFHQKKSWKKGRKKSSWKTVENLFLKNDVTDASMSFPDASMTFPDAFIIWREKNWRKKRKKKYFPDASLSFPGASMTFPDASMTFPGASMTFPYDNILFEIL